MAETPIGNLRDAERDSMFVDTITGKTYRRVKSEGEFVFSGLSKDFKVTVLKITDVPKKIPFTPLLDRNSLSIHNKGLVTLYVGDENTVEADTIEDSVLCGWEIPSKSYFNIDLKNLIELWAVCETGQETMIKILELS